MLINQPDIARYAVRVSPYNSLRDVSPKPRDKHGPDDTQPGVALWPQLVSMMTGKFVVFVLGIVSSAACKQIYGVRNTATFWPCGSER